MEPAEPEPPREGPPPPEVFIRTDGGSYIARDLDEVRRWVLQGRLLREDLISHAGGPEVRADLHPLTRHFFELLDAHEVAETGAPAMQEAPPGATEEEEAAPAAAAPVLEAAAGGPPSSEALPVEAIGAIARGEAELPAEAEATGIPEAAPAEPEKLPGGLRAIGILNLLLSLLPALNPVGIAAAIGYLRRRAWGRALTLLWALTTLLALVVGGLRIFRAPISADTLQRMAPGMPAGSVLRIVAVLGAVFTLYLLIVVLTLLQRSVAERFRGGGSLVAVLLALIFYGVLGLALTTGGAKDWIGRLLPHPPAPRVPPTPRVAAPVPAPAPPPTEFTEGRAFTPDGIASLEVPTAWRIWKITEGERAKLGVVLEGERRVPGGAMRLIVVDPAALVRQDQRFDRVDTKRGDIKEVEVVRRGEFEGRKVVTAFPVMGGTNGYLVLSLHDGDRGYQLRCGSKGPSFDTIRPDCERMAASLLVSSRSAAPAAAASVPAAPPAAPAPGSPAAGAPPASSTPAPLAAPSSSAPAAAPSAPSQNATGPSEPPSPAPVAPPASPPPAAAPSNP